MKIANKLLLLFFVLGLTPLIILGYASYARFESAMKDEVLSKLVSIADDRIDDIEKYLRERERDVTTLVHTPVVMEAMGEFDRIFRSPGPDSPEYDAINETFRPFSTFYKETLQYHDLLLVGTNNSPGDLVYSVSQEADFGTNLIDGPYNQTELAKVFDRTKTLLATETSAFRFYKPSGIPTAFFSAPVMKEGRLIGVAALQIDTDEIYRLAENYVGLGSTGEIVIAFREGDTIRLAAPMRHDPNAAFKRLIQIGSDEALPIQYAVRGKKGHGVSVDYRGKNILAAWRYLPQTEWGIVVKMDTDEAYARVYAMRNNALTVGLFALAALVCAALVLSKSISKPIGSLMRTTELMADGNLSVRTDVCRQDEIGSLASSFDSMAGQLQRRTKLMDAVNEVFRKALVCETVEDVASTALRTAEELTESKFGFIGRINEKGTLDTTAMSDPGWAECKLPHSEAMKQINDMKVRGIWGDVIANKAPLIVNDPESYPGRVGTPPEHQELTAFLGVPLRQGNDVFGLIALANKPGGYHEDDQSMIEALSVTCAEALKRKTEQVELQKHKDHLEELVAEKTKELKKKQDQYLSLFDGIDDVIYVSDPETYELLYVNDSFRQAWGEGVLGKKCYSILQNRDDPCPFCTNDLIMGEYLGRAYAWEFQNEVSKQWYRCADKAIRWTDGRLVRFELASDITPQKKAQDDLRHERELSDALIESLPGVFYMFDQNGRFLKWNRNLEAVTEYDHDEISKMAPFDLFVGEDRRLVEESVKRGFTDGKTKVEAQFSTKSRKKISYMFTGMLIEHDEKPYLVGVGVDITDRKKFEISLKESEEKFRSFVKRAPIPLCFVDLEGRLDYINDSFTKAFGYTLEDVPDIDAWWLRAYPDESYRKWVVETWNAAVERAGKKRTNIDLVEYRVTCKNGDVRIMQIGGVSLEDGMLATFIDVTELKKAEKMLKTMNKNLSRSNMELEQFAYVASHDLQEPLRMVASYVQLIERRYKDKLDADANDFIAFAVDGANRMKSLINDLLAFSRVETRKKTLGIINAGSALKEAEDNLRYMIQESGAVITKGSLPDLQGDRGQLAQLFQNLISNAIKYSGDKTPEIQIEVEEHDSEWLFSVKDNGIGIEPQFFDKIFVIFQQLHRKGQYSGTGIGLAICKRIVERHGGRIWAESNPGQGSIFFFTMPVGTKSSCQAALNTAIPASESVYSQLNNKPAR